MRIAASSFVRALCTSCMVVACIGATLAPWPADPIVTTTYPVSHPRALMVTTGGWAYCEQARPIARRSRFTLLCGRYFKDRYLGPGLRSGRHLDWGDPAYLARFAETIRSIHRKVGGSLILFGVSYSGFGVATLASHHPEIGVDRLI